jgi:N-acetylglutamate synthase-like GNAT family acetyltransferase
MFYEIDRNQMPSLLTVLKSAFDRDEIRSDEEIYSFYDSGKMKAYGNYENDTLTGGCFGWSVNDLFFVENLAIRKDLRDKGYGGKILEELKKRYGSMLLEVQPPEDPMTRKRVVFYLRHGFHLSNEEYILPPLQKNGSPLAYNLMSYHFSVNSETPERIYRKIYQKNTSVKELKKMM